LNNEYYNSDSSNIVKYTDEQLKLINDKLNCPKLTNNIEIQIYSKNEEDFNNIKENLNEVNEVYKVDDLKKK